MTHLMGDVSGVEEKSKAKSRMSAATLKSMYTAAAHIRAAIEAASAEDGPSSDSDGDDDPMVGADKARLHQVGGWSQWRAEPYHSMYRSMYRSQS